MHYTNVRIHSDVLDLIQVLIVRGDFSIQQLQSAGKVIIEKLCVSVHEDRYDLQNKLLHLLHFIFSGLSTTHDGRTKSTKPSEASSSQEFLLDFDIHPLLLPTLLDAIQKTAGRPILQYWLDFVLMTVPQFPRLLSYTVTPLSECLCRQLWSFVETLTHIARDTVSIRYDIRANVMDTEVIMLLNTLERLVILSLTKGGEPNAPEKEDEVTTEKINSEPSGGSGGILGIMTNVFTSETPTNASEETLSVSISPPMRCNILNLVRSSHPATKLFLRQYAFYMLYGY